MPLYRVEAEFLKCCGSAAWARGLARRRPFASLDRLKKAAEEVWWRLDEADWTEAFRAHPQIGQRETPAHASAQSQAWSAQEQAGLNRAGVGVRMALEEANQEYLERFGCIFIVCASGKSADEMLTMLRTRMSNSSEQEIRVAAEEQSKITRLRLEKLLA